MPRSSHTTTSSGTTAVDGDKKSAPPAPETFLDGQPLPKLFVFDLDYTLWACWADTHVAPPLKAQEGGHKLKDRLGEEFAFYDEVPGIIAALRHLKVQVGIASRSSAPDICREMLKLLKVSKETSLPQPSSTSRSTALFGSPSRAIDFFDQVQIFPGSKLTHFKNLHRDTGLPFEEMLFFDDEHRNREVESLGVTMQLIKSGVTRDVVDQAVRTWRKKYHRHAGS